jgi:hypothetical protein
MYPYIIIINSGLPTILGWHEEFGKRCNKWRI